MGQRLLTEAEWRRITTSKRRTSPACWGARCYDAHARKKRFLRNRQFHRILLLTSLITGIFLPVLKPVSSSETFADQLLPSSPSLPLVRSVSEITYMLPHIETERRVFSRAELARGRMLLLDEAHPLPYDVPVPNTASIAKTANGAIPVRSLDTKTGRQTIRALAELFSHLRNEQVNSFFVAKGAVTAAQQKQTLIDTMRSIMRTHPPETAAAMTLQSSEAPGCGELLQEHAVELGFMHTHSEGTLPEETAEGQLLLRLTWRYGFVRTNQRHPWRFRYVGKAHAAAMTYLDVDLPSYLEWLHQKRQLVVSNGEKPIYLILCTPLSGEYAAFDLPTNCTYEVSLDNTGYALAACLL